MLYIVHQKRKYKALVPDCTWGCSTWLLHHIHGCCIVQGRAEWHYDGNGVALCVRLLYTQNMKRGATSVVNLVNRRQGFGL